VYAFIRSQPAVGNYATNRVRASAQCVVHRPRRSECLAVSPLAHWRRYAPSYARQGLVTAGVLIDVSIGLGKDRQVVEREMGVIQELLDEQPDSKCMRVLLSASRLI
jgi:hypothetical protein